MSRCYFYIKERVCLNGSNVEQVIVTKDGEVIAVISDTEIIEKNGYEVKVEPIE